MTRIFSEDVVAQVLRRPSHFMYFEDLPIGTTWSLGPAVDHRDLGDTERAKFKRKVNAFKNAFGDEGVENGWQIVHTSHFLVGWMDHLAFRVLDDEGNQTPQLRLAMKLFTDEGEE